MPVDITYSVYFGACIYLGKIRNIPTYRRPSSFFLRCCIFKTNNTVHCILERNKEKRKKRTRKKTHFDNSFFISKVKRNERKTNNLKIDRETKETKTKQKNVKKWIQPEIE